MTVEEQQKIIDRVMHRVALNFGSSTRRDFTVACLTLDVLIENGNPASKGTSGSVPSAAPTSSSSYPREEPTR